MNRDHIYLPNLSKVKTDAIFTSVARTNPLPEKEYLDVIRGMGKALPFLEEISQDEKNNTITFKNRESDYTNQCIFAVSERARLSLAWGVNVSYDTIDRMITSFLKVLSETSEVTRMDLSFIDYRFRASFKHKGNHYSLIDKLFYENSTVSKLFAQDMTMQHDLKIKGYLNPVTICAIEIEGDTSKTEILKKDFLEKSIDIDVGIAKVEFKDLVSLGNEITEHIRISSEFMKNIVEPMILMKFESAL
jgi:hypothetical protein